MIRVIHNQTNEIKDLTFAVWEEKYNHNLWSILEFKDMVVMYQYKNNKKVSPQIVELEHAKEMVKTHDVSYEEYTLDEYNRDYNLKPSSSMRTKPKDNDLVKSPFDRINSNEDLLKQIREDSAPDFQPLSTEIAYLPDETTNVFATSEQLRDAQQRNLLTQNEVLRNWAGITEREAGSPIVFTVPPVERRTIFNKIGEFLKHPTVVTFKKDLLFPIMVTIIGGLVLFYITILLGWVKIP